LERPRVTHQIPTGQANMMLVTDHSGSMAAEDVQPTRLAAAVSAANAFIDQLPKTVRVGAIGFGTTPDAVQGPSATHAEARALEDSLIANGGTDTGDALQLALQLLQGSNAKHAPAAIVLLSDGQANAGPDPVSISQEAKKDRIPIYTVALGTAGGVLPNPDPFAPPQAVPPDPQLMQQIARVSGGRAFNARSADELSSIYKKLGSQLSSVTRKKEITWWFAAGGVVLLIGAVASSVRGSGRLP
jgi:Ca-activated chloride channel homolog